MKRKNIAPARRLGPVLTILALVMALASPSAAAGFKPLNELAARRKVEAWIKERLPLPQTYRGLDWSRLVLHKTGEVYHYSIRHRYRFRHPTGGVYILDRVFMFNYAGQIEGNEEIIPGREPEASRYRP